MKTPLTLALFLIIGFIGSRGFISKTRDRLPLTGLFITGMEFFLVGMLLGPHVLGIISDEVLHEIKPVIYLALGWAGLLFGLELNRKELGKVSGAIYRFLILDVSLLAPVFFLGGWFLLPRVLPGLAREERVFAAAVAALTAAVDSPAMVAIRAQRLPSRGRFTRTARLTSALGAVFPLLLFGLVYTIGQPAHFGRTGLPAGLLWWLFANAAGVMLGFVTVLFTSERCSDNERTLLIMGTVLLVGGLCYYFTFSALYIAMIMGVVVGNLSKRRQAIFHHLHQFEKTLYVALLIIIGATVVSSGVAVFYLTAAYVCLRLLLRLLGSSALFGWTQPEFRGMGAVGGLVLTAQGAIALAMALEYKMSAGGPFTDPVFTAVVLAVVVNEVLAYGLIGRAFRASGEVVVGSGAGRPRRNQPGGGS
jgi:hypothetical protein